MMLFYAGIGSRKTPGYILVRMREIAGKLELEGYILRSGGAEGADKAFESGVVMDCMKDIMKPIDDPPAEAIEVVKELHPSPKNAMKFKRYLGRDVMIITGKDVKNPVLPAFVIYWAVEDGGTKFTISVAEKYGVPCIDIGETDDEEIMAIARGKKLERDPLRHILPLF